MRGSFLAVMGLFAGLGAPAHALSPPPPVFESVRVLQPLHEGDVAVARVRSYCRLAETPARVLREGTQVLLVARNAGSICDGRVTEYDLPLGTFESGVYGISAEVCFGDECSTLATGRPFGTFGVLEPRAIPLLGVPGLAVLVGGVWVVARTRRRKPCDPGAQRASPGSERARGQSRL